MALVLCVIYSASAKGASACKAGKQGLAGLLVNSRSGVKASFQQVERGGSIASLIEAGSAQRCSTAKAELIGNTHSSKAVRAS